MMITQRFMSGVMPRESEDSICFTAAAQGSAINFFRNNTSSYIDTNRYIVYINGEKTTQLINSLTFNENDVIEIKALGASTVFPYFRPYYSTNSTLNYIKSIDKPLPLMSRTCRRDDPITSMGLVFRNCTRLTSVCDYLFKNNTNVTSFTYAFENCQSLSTIYSNIFRYNTLVTNFSSCFQRCDSLSTIPTDLFRYNTLVTNFTSCFYSSGVTAIPTGIFRYNTEVTSFKDCFESTLVSTLPSTLFRYNIKAEDFSGCFENCSNIQVIPTDLFRYNTIAYNFKQLFYGCTIIKTIPSNIFSYITSTTPDFSYCFSPGINSTNTVFTGEVPTLWLSFPNASAYSYCFRGLTKASNYSSIPSAWK